MHLHPSWIFGSDLNWEIFNSTFFRNNYYSLLNTLGLPVKNRLVWIKHKFVSKFSGCHPLEKSLGGFQPSKYISPFAS
jgi:hypothetical protein